MSQQCRRVRGAGRAGSGLARAVAVERRRRVETEKIVPPRQPQPRIVVILPAKDGAMAAGGRRRTRAA